MRGTSLQSLLDKVFATLGVDATPARSVSVRAFAKVRMTAIRRCPRPQGLAAVEQRLFPL